MSIQIFEKILYQRKFFTILLLRTKVAFSEYIIKILLIESPPHNRFEYTIYDSHKELIEESQNKINS